MSTSEPLPTERTEARRERGLLLSCARTELDAATADRIRRLAAAEVDWDQLTDAARLHDVFPLLYRALERACPDTVPPPVLEQLRELYRGNLIRNISMVRGLGKLLARFAERGLPAIVYTGPVLAFDVYGDIGLRRCLDLDVLVREEHVPAAARLLVESGYRPGREFEGGEEVRPSAQKGALGFLRDDDALKVDLHWDVSLYRDRYSFPLAREGVWDRLRPVGIFDMTFYSLPPEELLQVLCIHGARHEWGRLKWVCDVAELARHTDLDWERALEQARRLGNLRAVYFGTLLARDLLDAELPDEVERQAECDGEAVKLARAVLGRYGVDDDARSGFDAAPELPAYVRLKERRRDRWRYLLKAAARPNRRDRDAVPLPDSLGFLYYLIRPLRLVAKYGRRMAGGAAKHE